MVRPIAIWFLVAVVWAYVGTTAYHLYKPASDLEKRIKATRAVT